MANFTDNEATRRAETTTLQRDTISLKDSFAPKETSLLNAWAPGSHAETAKERWTGPLAALAAIPLFKTEITKEATQQVLQNNLAFQCSSMALQVASSHGPSVGGIPLDILARIYGQEILNRSMEIPRGICIVGHKLAELAKPDMTPAERELASRLAFGNLRIIDRLKSLGFEIDGVLDSDLMETREFKEARQDLKPYASSTYPLAFEEGALYEAARRVWGAQIVGSWTSFKSLEQFAHIKQGLSTERDWVRNCGVHAQTLLSSAAPNDFGFVFTEPGRANLGSSRLANPDVATPLIHYGTANDGSAEHGRFLLNCFNEPDFDQRFPDLFELDFDSQKAQLAELKHYRSLVENIRRITPEILPICDMEQADLSVAERLMKTWKQEFRYNPNRKNERHFWNSLLAVAEAFKKLLKKIFAALVSFFAVDLKHLDAPLTATTVALHTPASSGPLVLDDNAFDGSSDHNKKKYKKTANLNTNFMGMRKSLA